METVPCLETFSIYLIKQEVIGNFFQGKIPSLETIFVKIQNLGIFGLVFHLFSVLESEMRDLYVFNLIKDMFLIKLNVKLLV